MMDRPAGAPDADHPLLMAARYSNAEAEDHTLSTVFEKRGLKLADVQYLAYQRAMRAVLALTGREAEANVSQSGPVELSDKDHATIEMLVPCYMDGILIGWRGNELATQEASA